MIKINPAHNVQDKRSIVQALKLEIAMIRDGGYNPPSGHPREKPRLLRDSITCPNVTLPDDKKEVPCEECLLHRFLPADHPHRDIACYDIPLNANGDTLAKLAVQEETDPEKVHAALLSWLYKTVAKLEAELNAEARSCSIPGAGDQTFSSCNVEHHG